MPPPYRCAGGALKLTDVPSGFRKCRSTSAVAADGFATSTYRSKNVPVAPSARNQSVAGAATPVVFGKDDYAYGWINQVTCAGSP